MEGETIVSPNKISIAKKCVKKALSAKELGNYGDIMDKLEDHLRRLKRKEEPDIEDIMSLVSALRGRISKQIACVDIRTDV